MNISYICCIIDMHVVDTIYHWLSESVMQAGVCFVPFEFDEPLVVGCVPLVVGGVPLVVGGVPLVVGGVPVSRQDN